MTTAPTPTPPLISDDAPKRAVLYTRISFDRTKEGLAVERQEEACRALAVARGWQVVGHYPERERSALKKREQYQQMIKDARAGRFDVIISWAVDRLTRTPREIEDLINIAEQTGVIIATVSGDLDLSTDQGRLVGRILGSVARAEVERKGQRQRAAIRQKAEMGLPPSNGRAFGYQIDGTVIPHEAEIVRDLFARYVAGVGASSLHRELNQRGITNTRGNKWDRYGMTYLLQNTRYIGERSILRRDAKGVNYREYIRKGKWSAIVDVEIFRAAQEKFARQKEKNGGKTAPNKRWLGAGLYRCGLCGEKMFSNYKQSKLADGTYKTRRVYICRETMHLLRTAEQIDQLVEKEVGMYLRDNGVKVDDDHDAIEAKRLKAEIRELDARMTNAEKAAAGGTISFEMLGRIEREIKEQIAGLEVEQAKHGERSASALIAGAADPGRAWLELLRDGKVAAAQQIVREHATITLLPVGAGRRPFDSNSVRIVWQ